MRKTIEKFGDWCLDSLPNKLIVLLIGLIAACILVQIGIYKGRELARAEAKAHAPWASEDR